MPDHQPGTYRVGNHWHGRTIVRVGHQPPDRGGVRRPDDQLIAHVDSAAPEGWAERTCALHNGDQDAVRLLEYALHLRQYGERAPGGNETWVEFDRRCEAFLRQAAAADTPPGPPRSTETAQQPTAGGTGTAEGSQTVSGGRGGEPWTQADSDRLLRDAIAASRQPEGAETVSVGADGRSAHRDTCRMTDPVSDDSSYCHGTGWRCPRHGTVT